MPAAEIRSNGILYFMRAMLGLAVIIGAAVGGLLIFRSRPVELELAPTPSAAPVLAAPGGTSAAPPISTPTYFYIDKISVFKYCENSQPYTHLRFKFSTVFTTRIDWSGSGDDFPTETVKFSYGITKLQGALSDGSLLVLDAPAGAPAIDMTCNLVKEDPDSLLFNCSGPQDSTVPILINGLPFDVPFMACAQKGKEQDQEPGPGAPPCSSIICP